MFLHLDPRLGDVVVPPWFRKQPQLVLQVGLNLAVRIPDLTVDENGVTCTLSFNRSPFFCVLPWPSIYAMTAEDGRAMVWPDDIPKELAASFGRPTAEPKSPPVLRQVKQPEAPSRSKKPRKRNKFADEPVRAVPMPPPEPLRTEDPSPAPSTSRKPKRELPPYLRVVK